MTRIRIGDRIKFRVTTRDGTRTAHRFVTGFWLGQPEVSYWGWRGFVVKPSEVLEVTPVNPRASWASDDNREIAVTLPEPA